jgi:hypothetical protein
MCLRGWLLRAACPRLVPAPARNAMRPEVVAGCSGGSSMNAVPLTSRQCRFAQWSYLTNGFLPGTLGTDVSSSSIFPPAPPYFVHVLVYGAVARSDLPFPLPKGPPQHLSDALLQSNHPGRAILVGDVRWGGHKGQLILAPSYPGGGEVGSHLVFSYRTGRIIHGISLHPWSSEYRYSIVSGPANVKGTHTVRLAPDPAYPEIVRALEAIVRSSR